MSELSVQNNQGSAVVDDAAPVTGSFSADLRPATQPDSFMRHFQTAAIILAGFVAAAEQSGSLNGLQGASRAYSTQARPIALAGG